MKKRIIINTVALIVVASAGTYFSLNRADKKEYFTVTQLANIDALVQTEGEEGTPIGDCYLNLSVNGDPDFFYLCNSSTSETMIYPCPGMTSYGIPDKSSKNKCTK